MNILVTGANGFIGSTFSRLALSHGHQIAGLIRPANPLPAISSSGEPVTWLKGSLAEPPWKEIEKFKPQACLHLAWIATPGVYLESPENESYFHWSREFIGRVRELDAGQIVVAGTCLEYRLSNEKMSEDRTTVEPRTTYARWKNALRVALEEDAKKSSFRLCWSRVFYLYGAGEHPAKLCTSITQKLARGEKIVLKTPNNTKDYIYVDDLASAFLTVLEKQFDGIINFGNGIGTTVKEIAQTIGRMMNREELIEIAVPPQVDPLGDIVADASKLHGLGWKPEYDLRRGLEKIVATAPASSTR